MNAADWYDLMAEKGDRVVDQVRKHLPDVDFTTIRAGLPPIVYLQQRRGMAEVTVNAVRLYLDKAGNVSGVKILTPSSRISAANRSW